VPEPRAWINPIGGLGDTLMLSGVLKLALDRTPSLRYDLVRRTRYSSILAGHPAIGCVGFPPADARIVRTDYWTSEPLGEGRQRAFQILARMFGLPTPIEERLYLPGEPPAHDPLLDMLPFGTREIVIIAPTSESPRKMCLLSLWERLAAWLRERGACVAQAGMGTDPAVRGSYSLLGLTTPRQLVGVLRRSALVVTVDNFVMHLAHLAEVPAVVLWGPTDPATYGYPEQVHLHDHPARCPERAECLGARHPDHYGTPCPLGPQHCTATIGLDVVQRAVESLLSVSTPPRPEHCHGPE
jgi:ADP-heptose:LPS heptosyltransferase